MLVLPLTAFLLALPQVLPGRHHDSTVVLTTDAITRMTTFWTAFKKEPDSVLHAPLEKQIAVSTVHGGQFPLMVKDIPALAAKYPSVAADLQRAGLTAQQYEADALAIVEASFNQQLLDAAGGAGGTPVSPTSALGQNMTFVRAHTKELNALATTPGDTVRKKTP